MTPLASSTTARNLGRSDRSAWAALTLEVLIGTSAVVGAWALVRDWWRLDLELVSPLPVDSWVLPGIALAVAIALPMVTAAVLELRRDRLAPVASVASGLVLAAWMCLQLLLGGLSLPPVQIFCLASAAALVTLRGRAARTALHGESR
jgi:hypothetical protein